MNSPSPQPKQTHLKKCLTAVVKRLDEVSTKDLKAIHELFRRELDKRETRNTKRTIQ